jgi:hypothetical protein
MYIIIVAHAADAYAAIQLKTAIAAMLGLIQQKEDG